MRPPLGPLLLLLLAILALPAPAPAAGFTPPCLEPLGFLRGMTLGEPAGWPAAGTAILAEHPDLPAYVAGSLEAALDRINARELVQSPGTQPLDPIPDFTLGRAAARGLAAVGGVLSRAGRTAEALACFRCALKLGIVFTRAGFGGPVSLISNMIGIATINIGLGGLHACLLADASDEVELVRLAGDFDRLVRTRAPLSFSLRYEYENFLVVIDQIQNDPQLAGYQASLKGPVLRQVKAYYAADVAPVFARAERLADARYCDSGTGFVELAGELDRLIASTKVRWWTAWWDPAWAVSRILISIALPTFDRAIRQDARTSSLLAGTVVAIGARIGYLRTKRWPENYSELPALPGIAYPTDPLTGRPFLMKRAGEGLKLYSAGWNGVDEEGRSDNGRDDVPLFAPENRK